mmetsp:Transcript_4049/g.8534  ORF Transcript_4049/g.8534 Transcript_4049/m.8534 type:complete len:102 (+) Transcript_4049:1041-1346(+)
MRAQPKSTSFTSASSSFQQLNIKFSGFKSALFFLGEKSENIRCALYAADEDNEKNSLNNSSRMHECKSLCKLSKKGSSHYFRVGAMRYQMFEYFSSLNQLH